jgi:two-component system, OmpR family, sensor histidine kinase BaeS
MKDQERGASCGPPWLRGPGRRRPPWWPETEPWPPAGPPGAHAWRLMGRRFVRRAVALLAAVVVLTAGLAALAVWVAARLSGALTGQTGWAAVAPAVLAAMLALVLAGAIRAAHGLRRTAAPLRDLVEGIARVADGDYAARARERGPAEVRALARAFNRMAEGLDRHQAERRRLLADISHELRTPLAVLRGNLEGILDGVYPADPAHLAVALEETQVLARLVDDLHMLAMAEGPGLRLLRQPTDVADLAREAIVAFRGPAEAAGVTLGLEAPAGLPPAEVDPERIRQVLTNLLANALRHTPPGGTIRVRVTADGADPLTVAVEDTGRGIPASELPHVFDRFHKSADSPGSGLGLAIARSLVRAHGGEIAADSEPGRGTTVRLTLPPAL